MIEDVIRKYGLIIFFAILLLHLIFADGGLVSYVKMKRNIRTAEATITKLDRENVRLKNEVDRLQKDDKYLEEIVVEKYGFIREGERLYRVEK